MSRFRVFRADFVSRCIAGTRVALANGSAARIASPAVCRGIRYHASQRDAAGTVFAGIVHCSSPTLRHYQELIEALR